VNLLIRLKKKGTEQREKLTKGKRGKTLQGVFVPRKRYRAKKREVCYPSKSHPRERGEHEEGVLRALQMPRVMEKEGKAVKCQGKKESRPKGGKKGVKKRTHTVRFDARRTRLTDVERGREKGWK